MATRTARPSKTSTPSATKALAPVQVAPMTSAKAPATGARKPAVKKPASPIKATAKPAVKTAVKPLLQAAVRSVRKPVTPPKTNKSGKDKKPKLVRDSFTVPKAEYMVLDELKLRADTLMTSAKKSALIRAGIKALAGMSDTAFLAALKAVPALKTGRPKK